MPATVFYTRDGRLEPGSEALVEAMLDRLAAAEKPRLLLFVHGGLVPRKVGASAATKLTGLLGPLSGEGWELGFPVWHSGIGEAIRINQDELAAEPRFERIVLRIVETIDRLLGGGVVDAAFLKMADSDGAGVPLDAPEEPSGELVAARLPADERERARNAEGLLEAHLEATDFAAAILDDPGLVALLEADLPLMDERIRARARAARSVPLQAEAGAKALRFPAAWVVALAAAKAGYRVLERLLRDRGHGVWPTVVEEIIGALYLDRAGALAWDLMKRDARQHFEGAGPGTLILDRLAAIARSGKDVRLLVIGHSAGSLFSGQLALAAVRAPANLRVEHILLAPAIRIDEATETFARGRFDGLRIFTMDDRHESANRLDGNAFGKLYPRSLLYLISGVLERTGTHRYADAPLLGMQRHLKPAYSASRSERAALDSLEAMLGPLPDALVYSPSGDARPGRGTGSVKHGGFWQDERTVESVTWIARNGFAA